MATSGSAPPGWALPRLTAQRKQDLAGKGVPQNAIAALERSLGAIAPYLTPKPAANDVRKPLKKLQVLLDRADAIVQELSQSSEAAQNEAWRHLCLEGRATGTPDPLAAVTALKAAVDRTVGLAPQRRGPTTSPGAVQVVHEVLVHQGLTKLTTGAVFEEIVGIVFEAASGGLRSTDQSVDRQVKDFKRADKATGTDPLAAQLAKWRANQEPK